MKKTFSHPSERRQFFRIDDDINLFYKKIDVNFMQNSKDLSGEVLRHCSLAAALDILGQESQIIFSRIERNTPDVAEYLKVINSKIDLLSRAVLMEGNDLSEQQSRNASLSASGVAFECEEMLTGGDFLELRLLLTSCLAVIVCYGQVVYCRKNHADNPEFPYVVGVEYTDMKEQDRELLIKHVVKRQIQQIREHKES